MGEGSKHPSPSERKLRERQQCSSAVAVEVQRGEGGGREGRMRGVLVVTFPHYSRSTRLGPGPADGPGRPLPLATNVIIGFAGGNLKCTCYRPPLESLLLLLNL